MTPNNSPPAPDHFNAVIFAIVALCAVAAATVVAVMVFHRDATPGENMEILHILLGGVLGPAITALLAFALYSLKGTVNQGVINTNGRVDELLELTRNTAHAAGVAQGRHEIGG